jgi:hypothetical protein
MRATWLLALLALARAGSVDICQGGTGLCALPNGVCPPCAQDGCVAGIHRTCPSDACTVAVTGTCGAFPLFCGLISNYPTAGQPSLAVARAAPSVTAFACPGTGQFCSGGQICSGFNCADCSISFATHQSGCNVYKCRLGNPFWGCGRTSGVSFPSGRCQPTDCDVGTAGTPPLSGTCNAGQTCCAGDCTSVCAFGFECCGGTCGCAIGKCTSDSTQCCGGATPFVSNSDATQCVECNLDGDCPAGKPRCRSHVCVQCAFGVDCPGTEYCDVRSFPPACVAACAADAGRLTSFGGVPIRECVNCATGLDCLNNGAGNTECDAPTGKCVSACAPTRGRTGIPAASPASAICGALSFLGTPTLNALVAAAFFGSPGPWGTCGAAPTTCAQLDACLGTTNGILTCVVCQSAADCMWPAFGVPGPTAAGPACTTIAGNNVCNNPCSAGEGWSATLGFFVPPNAPPGIACMPHCLIDDDCRQPGIRANVISQAPYIAGSYTPTALCVSGHVCGDGCPDYAVFYGADPTQSYGGQCSGCLVGDQCVKRGLGGRAFCDTTGDQNPDPTAPAGYHTCVVACSPAQGELDLLGLDLCDYCVTGFDCIHGPNKLLVDNSCDTTTLPHATCLHTTPAGVVRATPLPTAQWADEPHCAAKLGQSGFNLASDAQRTGLLVQATANAVIAAAQAIDDEVTVANAAYNSMRALLGLPTIAGPLPTPFPIDYVAAANFEAGNHAFFTAVANSVTNGVYTCYYCNGGIDCGQPPGMPTRSTALCDRYHYAPGSQLCVADCVTQDPRTSTPDRSAGLIVVPLGFTCVECDRFVVFAPECLHCYADGAVCSTLTGGGGYNGALAKCHRCDPGALVFGLVGAGGAFDRAGAWDWIHRPEAGPEERAAWDTWLRLNATALPEPNPRPDPPDPREE